MWLRLMFSLAWATVAVWATAGPALAGGLAVTTIDALPEEGIQAGATYRLGYTIRQHGQTPFDGAKTSIRITSASTGEDQRFAGLPDGRPGHYVAEVVFPSAGEWSWEVSQYPFAPQSLGTITVAAPVSAASAGAVQAWPGWTAESLPEPWSGVGALTWLRPVLVVATLCTLVLFGLRLSAVVRRRRGGTGLPSRRALPGTPQPQAHLTSR